MSAINPVQGPDILPVWGRTPYGGVVGGGGVVSGYAPWRAPITSVLPDNTVTNSNGLVSTTASVPGTPATSTAAQDVPVIANGSITGTTSYTWVLWVLAALAVWWLVAK